MSYRPNQREKHARLMKGKVTRKPNPYVGLIGPPRVNTQQFIQPKPVQPTSSTATITRPDQQQQGTGSPGVDTLAGLQKGYEETTSAYKKGQNAKDWYKTAGDSGLSPQERLEDTYGMFSDFATGEDSYSNAEMFSSRLKNYEKGMEGMPTQFDGFSTNTSSPAATPITPPQDMGVWNQTQPMPQPTVPINVGPGSAAQASYFHPGVAGGPGNASQAFSGLSGPTSSSLGGTPNFGMGQFTADAGGLLSDTSLAMPTDTLSMGGLGGEVAAEGSAASSGSGSMAGKVGAGAGVAFNAYDMSQNGINAGNAMGLVGSGILLTVGAANAWNPIGWALLAGSAAYSLFG